MKQNAESASRDRSGGARYVAGQIADYVRQGGDVELHLVGHSAGSIFHGHLVPQLARLGLPVHTLTLFAPACTMQLFEENILGHLGGAIERLSVFNLTDAAEQDDTVGPAYHKSLLYLVSEAFETGKGVALAGMQKFWTADSNAVGSLGKPVFESARGVVHTSGGPRLKIGTDSRTHGGFDNDEQTLNSMLRIILGSNALRKPFVATASAATR